MNAAKTIEAPEPYRHVLNCEDCPRKIETEDKNAAFARRRCWQEARERGWALWKEKDTWRGRCPACDSARVREDSERKLLLRAKNRKDEDKRIREAKKEAESRRATRPVGKKVAEADNISGMNAATPKLIHRNNFERLVAGYIKNRPEMLNAADHFANLLEAAAGVSDKELYQEKTDGGSTDFEPQRHQIDAITALKRARADIGSELYTAVDMCISLDKTPAEIGARYKFAKTDRARAEMGMTVIKVGLAALATHWRMG